MRILIVEDEPRLAGHIATALEQDRHEAKVLHDGKAALAEALDGSYDLIVLDVGLPGLDGFSLLAQLRAARLASRVLMLTARAEVSDRVEGLTRGADDYLTKPFAMQELVARVQALGRRFVAEPATVLRVDSLVLDLTHREVRRAGRLIELSAREFVLLKLLMHEPGRVFTRTELCERVWEREHEYDTKLVEVFIGRLRRKIDEPPAPPLIHTVRHLGYTLREPESPRSGVRPGADDCSAQPPIP
jgi:DNA-binding response OmpR family regulator